MSDQVAIALITTFGGLISTLLAIVVKQIHGLRADLSKMQEEHVTRIVTLELRMQRLEHSVASVIAT